MIRIKTIQCFTLFYLLFAVSCINVPVEITLDKAVSMNDQEVQNVVDDIHKHLKEAKLASPNTPGATISADECNNVFNAWLDKQFAQYLIPKKNVTPFEYAKVQLEQNPLLSQCKNVNLDFEFTDAIRETAASSTTQSKAALFKLNDFREKLSSTKCVKNFIDPEKKKLTLLGMSLSVTQNTLNVKAPKYNIYYTTKQIRESELQLANAEKTLVKDGQLVKFAESEIIPARFEGEQPVFFSRELKEFDVIQERFGVANSDLIAIPALIGQEPAISTIGGQSYYVVPKGHIAFYIALKLSVKAELADALCALEEYKKEQKELDEERRRNHRK